MTDFAPRDDRRRLWLALLGVFQGVLIAAAAWELIRPLHDASPQFPFEDKVKHVVGFIGLTAPCALGLTGRRLIFGAATLCAFGGAMEIVQDLSGLGRVGDAADFAADCVGVLAGGLIFSRLRPYLLGIFGLRPV